MFETGEAIAHAFIDRWNAHDADGLADLFAENADFVNVVGLWWRNRRAIRKAHDYGFRRIFQNARLEILEVRPRMLTPDIHIVHVVLGLEGQTGPDGSPTGPRVTVVSLVAQRGADGFAIISFQNTDRVDGADTHVSDSGGFRPASYQA